MDNPDFNIIIKWNRFMLNSVGIWPEIQERLPLQFIGSLFILIYFIVVPQMIDLYIIHSDINLVAENLATANIAITIAVIKLFTLWYYKKDLCVLIKYMRDDWKNAKNQHHLVAMRKMARITRYITNMLLIFTQIMLIIFLSMNIVLNTTGFFPSRRLYYRSFFFYDTFESPVYEITCFWQAFGGILAALAYSGTDSFIGMLVLHVCGQLSVLQYELKHLTDPIINKENDAINLIHEKLKYIVIQHEYLNRFARSIEDSFNLMLLIQFVSLSLQLCFQGYTIYNAITHGAEVTVIQLLFMIIFYFEVFLLFLLYCYVGEQLYIETLEIRNAAFESKWYYLTTSQIKVLAYIILRTNTPLRITAGKFSSFTMVTFNEVVKRSVGYLSVLVTLKD